MPTKKNKLQVDPAEAMTTPGEPSCKSLRPTTVVDEDLSVVKLGEVVLQGSESKVKLISEADLRAATLVYKKREGAYPEKEDLPTLEQASAFLALIFVKNSVYVDFAVFGPHGDRLIKRVGFEAMAIGPDGKMQRVEMLGPASYREWYLSFRVFRTLCIMFELVSPARLDRYAAKIQKFVGDYPDTWGLIYQTDVRARLEQAPDTREDLEREYAEALVSNQVTHYDLVMPWHGLFERLTSGENNFYSKSLE